MKYIEHITCMFYLPYRIHKWQFILLILAARIYHLHSLKMTI